MPPCDDSSFGLGRSPQRDLDAAEAVRILARLEAAGIAAWVDGGWGVDALLGTETRPHDDLDLVVELADVPRLHEELAALGYTRRRGDAPTSFETVDPDGRQVDVHPARFAANGDGVYRLHSGGDWIYPAEGFGWTGTIAGREVRCLSPAVQLLCHRDYELDDQDRRDVEALRRRFSL
jgi:lincosamide nucleotidyltransferase A/C/D/E